MIHAEGGVSAVRQKGVDIHKDILTRMKNRGIDLAFDRLDYILTTLGWKPEVRFRPQSGNVDVPRNVDVPAATLQSLANHLLTLSEAGQLTPDALQESLIAINVAVRDIEAFANKEGITL